MDLIATYGPMAALLGFFIAFLWIAFSTYRPRNKTTLRNHAFIPLKEETSDEPK